MSIIEFRQTGVVKRNDSFVSSLKILFSKCRPQRDDHIETRSTDARGVRAIMGVQYVF